MITLNNYKERSKVIDFSKYPTLKEGHDFVIENADLYELDPDIKSFIDTHIEAVNSLAEPAEKKPVPVKTEKPKAEKKSVKKSAAKKSVKKVVQQIKKDKQYIKKQITSDKPIDKKKLKVAKIAKVKLAPAKKPKPAPKKVEKISPEITLLRRVIRMANKEVPSEKVLLVVNAMHKAMLDKSIRKTSEHAPLIKDIESKLRAVLANGMPESIDLNIAPEKLNKWVAIAGGEKVYPSVKIIKRFISIQGKAPVKEKIDSLKELIKKSKVSKDDPYYKQVKNIESAIKSKAAVLKVTKQELNGLEGIVNSCGCEEFDLSGIEEEVARQTATVAETIPAKPEEGPVKKGVLLRADQLDKVKRAEGFYLEGEEGKLLGKIKPFMWALTLEGPKGAGKTTFVSRLLPAFLKAGHEVDWFDLEQGGEESEDTVQMINENIPEELRHKLYLAGEAPEGLKTIEKHATPGKVIFIDSEGKIQKNREREMIDYMRRKYPHTLFIWNLQVTSGGVARGGTAAGHDATVVLVAKKPDHTFRNNYIYPEKNRGNRTDLRYNIWEGKTYTEEEVEAMQREKEEAA